MSSCEALFPCRSILVGCALLGMHALACSGGSGFSDKDSALDGSTSGASQTSDDSDASVVVIANPNGDDASAEGANDEGASPDAGTDAAADAQAAVDATSISPSCSPSELDCGGLCVPIDTNNCGACGTKCAAPDGGTATCTEASRAYSCGIACGTNLTHCGNACVDSQSDSNNCGRCGHGCASGACVAGECQSWVVANTSAQNAGLPVVRAGVYGVVDIVADGSNVVWIDTTEGVLQASAAGASAPIINLAPFQRSTTSSPSNLAMANGVVVWTVLDVNNGVSVWTATEGVGNSGASIASLGSSSAGDLPSGLALDATGANAYFLDSQNGSNPSPHSPGLYKCDLGNKSCSLLYDVTLPQTFLLSNDVAFGDARLFWTDSTAGSVLRADYSTNQVGTAVSGQNGPCLLALDATYVYWVDVSPADAGAGSAASFSIARTSQSSPGTVTSVVPSASGTLSGMGTDGTNLYFIGGADQGELLYAPADGSAAPRSLKDGQQAYAIAVAGGAIYWLNGDNTIDGIAAP
jgi:hypothetical protein